MKNKNSILIIIICIFLIPQINALAEDNGDLTIGMSSAFSGPAKELGINIRKGVLVDISLPMLERAMARISSEKALKKARNL
ncbi:MAG: hypothetical protein KAJ31_06270 [Deltaproteobacteria bacterium]|nr:hypothetical protein [Deltaproteobacteria bacterium]